ncbi:MAG: hypothetical protein AAF918_16100 [Pseudomonadota bacterium]
MSGDNMKAKFATSEEDFIWNVCSLQNARINQNRALAAGNDAQANFYAGYIAALLDRAEHLLEDPEIPAGGSESNKPPINVPS